LSPNLSFSTLAPDFTSPIEEGRVGSKSPHYKFGYFLSVSQQAVSADITKNSPVGKIMQDLNHEY
jgi:hypothetical protein